MAYAVVEMAEYGLRIVGNVMQTELKADRLGGHRGKNRYSIFKNFSYLGSFLEDVFG